MIEWLHNLARTSWGRLLIAILGTLLGLALTTLPGLLLGRMPSLPDRMLVSLCLGGMLAVLLARAR